LRDTPVRLSDERIAILISNLPDPAAKEELITGHLRLGKHLVKCARRRYGGDGDDMLSAAMLGLVRCIERLASGEKVLEDGNISRWVARRMMGEIRNAACNSPIGHPSTIFRHATKDKPILKRQEKSVESYDFFDRADFVEEVDRLDEIRSILKTDTERSVFDLRYQGRSDVEIANLLKLSVRTIYNVREAIGKRFLEINNE
jgi:RNA polymerase sigma factor (sigma-70 family)